MARIRFYPEDNNLHPSDHIVGTDEVSGGGATRVFTVQALENYLFDAFEPLFVATGEAMPDSILPNGILLGGDNNIIQEVVSCPAPTNLHESPYRIFGYTTTLGGVVLEISTEGNGFEYFAGSLPGATFTAVGDNSGISYSGTITAFTEYQATTITGGSDVVLRFTLTEVSPALPTIDVATNSFETFNNNFVITSEISKFTTGIGGAVTIGGDLQVEGDIVVDGAAIDLTDLSSRVADSENNIEINTQDIAEKANTTDLHPAASIPVPNPSVSGTATTALTGISLNPTTQELTVTRGTVPVIIGDIDTGGTDLTFNSTPISELNIPSTSSGNVSFSLNGSDLVGDVDFASVNVYNFDTTGDATHNVIFDVVGNSVSANVNIDPDTHVSITDGTVTTDVDDVITLGTNLSFTRVDTTNVTLNATGGGGGTADVAAVADLPDTADNNDVAFISGLGDDDAEGVYIYATNTWKNIANTRAAQVILTTLNDGSNLSEPGATIEFTDSRVSTEINSLNGRVLVDTSGITGLTTTPIVASGVTLSGLDGPGIYGDRQFIRIPISAEAAFQTLGAGTQIEFVDEDGNVNLGDFTFVRMEDTRYVVDGSSVTQNAAYDMQGELLQRFSAGSFVSANGNVWTMSDLPEATLAAVTAYFDARALDSGVDKTLTLTNTTSGAFGGIAEAISENTITVLDGSPTPSVGDVLEFLSVSKVFTITAKPTSAAGGLTVTGDLDVTGTINNTSANTVPVNDANGVLTDSVITQASTENEGTTFNTVSITSGEGEGAVQNSLNVNGTTIGTNGAVSVVNLALQTAAVADNALGGGSAPDALVYKDGQTRRISIGAVGEVLTVTDGNPLSLQWATPSAGTADRIAVIDRTDSNSISNLQIEIIANDGTPTGAGFLTFRKEA